MYTVEFEGIVYYGLTGAPGTLLDENEVGSLSDSNVSKSDAALRLDIVSTNVRWGRDRSSLDRSR